MIRPRQQVVEKIPGKQPVVYNKSGVGGGYANKCTGVVGYDEPFDGRRRTA